MQITLDLPDELAQQVLTLPAPHQFLANLLKQVLPEPGATDSWVTFSAELEQHAVDTGVPDLALHHDDDLSPQL
jgi:hypothetical protein